MGTVKTETETKGEAGQMWILLENSKLCFLHIQRTCCLGPVLPSLTCHPKVGPVQRA